MQVLRSSFDVINYRLVALLRVKDNNEKAQAQVVGPFYDRLEVEEVHLVLRTGSYRAL